MISSEITSIRKVWRPREVEAEFAGAAAAVDAAAAAAAAAAARHLRRPRSAVGARGNLLRLNLRQEF